MLKSTPLPGAAAATDQSSLCRVRISMVNGKVQDLKSSDDSDACNSGMQDIEVYLVRKDESTHQKACRFSLSEDCILLNITYPFATGSQLKIVQLPTLVVPDEKPVDSQIPASEETTPLELIVIELSELSLEDTRKATLTSPESSSQGQSIQVTLELDDNKLEESICVPPTVTPEQAIDPALSSEVHYKFDFSATNLPLKAKIFSFFKGGPLLSFYELVSHRPLPGGNGKQQNVLFESDVSKMATTDPFWTLTHAIPRSLVDPAFTINVYQSSDVEKSKRALVCSVTIELESIIGPEKETMFDVPGTDGKTVLMLDRLQEVPPLTQQSV